MSDQIAQTSACTSGLRGARRRRLCHFAGNLLLGVAVLGCAQGQTELSYLSEKGLDHYKSMATTIDFPAVDPQTDREVTFANRPRTVLDREKDEVWDISLADTIQLAIQNNTLIRSRADNRTPSVILSAGDRAPSVYDPAIQETGVLFGGRGVEAALAAFDAQLNTTMTWGRNEVPQNNLFLGGGVGAGSVIVNETGAFNSVLSKQFANGGSFALGHQMNYTGNNLPSGTGMNKPELFSSVYTGNVNAQYRHPLLAGSGAEFTRIAGPIAQNFGGLSGVTQGVVIARINQDISLADFETGVITMLKDVEDLYWELSLRYHEYDTTVTARNSALQSWREAHRILEAGGKQGFKPSDEAQARDFYFQARAAAETSLSSVFSAEVVLRRILGLPVSDGRTMRPSDEPATALLRPSWDVCLTEALTQRVELRRQKWTIKSLQLQLSAAENLTRPRFDFVSGYQVNTMGDELFGKDGAAGTPAPQFHSAYAALAQGNLTGWNLGFEFNMPLGLRAAHAQVRNIELRLAKAREQLTAQEMEISHELAQDFQNLAVQHLTAQTNFNRYRAAQQRVQLFKAEVEAGTKTFDVLLRALSSQAEAEVAYYRSLIEYNKAITALHYHKGTLLPHDQVWLSESEWTPEAYKDALRHAWARTHACDAPQLDTVPAEFVEQPNWSASELAPAGEDAPPVQATPPEAVPYEDEFPIPPPKPATPKPSTEKDAFAE